MMNSKVPAVVALLAILLFLPGSAKAMSIETFARMNMDDESTFVAMLVEASAKMLTDSGQPDQGQKAVTLFKDASDNGGVHRLAANLKMLNGLNNRNATNSRTANQVYGVEDAMELTFKDAGIIVPAKFLLTVSKNFSPSGPMRH